jgi:signal transduction histidine kinase
MTELRRLLAALGPAETGPELRPAPGLDRLEGLVEPLRSLGVTVALRREEDAAVTVPAGVSLSAFRIVQEAVTNIVRHAGARRVEVLVRAGPAAVELSVVDDGRGSGSRETLELGGGRGIAGMRERAAMLGGSLDAGPRPGGGFQVRARLPLAVPR